MIGKAGMMSQRPAWSPSALSPLAWYDAQTESTITKSSNVISQWNDRGTNGNNVSNDFNTAVRPTYSATAINGLPAITATANGILSVALSGTSSLTNKLSVFAVAYVANNGDGTNGRLLSLTDGDLGSDENNASRAALMRRDGANARIDARRSNTDLSEKTVTYDTPFIAAGIFDGTNHTTYIDGVAGTAVASTGNFTDYVPSLAVLGNFNASPSYWRGGVGEIMVVIGDVGTSDRQKVEGYLAHRWGLTGNLDSGHPYKTSPP